MDGVRLLLGESPFKNGQGTTQEKHREDTLIFIKYHLVIIITIMGSIWEGHSPP